jgi:hypothetical protein
MGFCGEPVAGTTRTAGSGVRSGETGWPKRPAPRPGPTSQICALAGTLICDEDGLYDPGEFNDRLLLGLKGTMSEALCRHRHRASYADPAVMPTGRQKLAAVSVPGCRYSA